jgi:hypothetical protein
VEERRNYLMGLIGHRVAVFSISWSASLFLGGQVANRDIGEIAANIISTGGAVGGVQEQCGCDLIVVPSKAVSKADAGDQLDKLSRTYPLTWTNNHNAYTVRIGATTNKSLLDIVIPQITVIKGNVVASTGILLGSQAIQDAQKSLGVKLLDRSLGFAGVAAISPSGEKEMVLPRGTLAEDLNGLAASSGTAVWIYQERRCDGRVVAQLSWVHR